MKPVKKESRKVWLAVIVSLLLHVLVAFSLAAFGGTAALPPLEQEKPAELTMIDLSATPPPVAAAVPPNPGYMETDPSKAAAQPPKEKTFESNANSVAASNEPAEGKNPLPSQKGNDRPFMDLETHASSLASEGAPPEPQVKAKPPAPEAVKEAASPTPTPIAKVTPSPTAAPTAQPTAPPDQFALLTATPPPPIAPQEVAEATPDPAIESRPAPPVPRPRPERPSSAYRSQKDQTRITGSITKRGASAVDAVETPLGRYKKTVTDAIGSRWYYYMKWKGDIAKVGTARVQAYVNPQGKVEDLKLISNNSNEGFANICLQSFQEAQIPPIPPDLVATFPDGRMALEFSFGAY